MPSDARQRKPRRVPPAVRPLLAAVIQRSPEPARRLARPMGRQTRGRDRCRRRKTPRRCNAIRKPIFCVVFNDGNQWSVEAEWPDGTIGRIDTFKAHIEAVDWLDRQSQAWLAGRTGLIT